MAGANRRTSAFCQGSEPGLGAAVQSTAGTELPGRGEEPSPTALQLPLPQLRFQPLPRAHRVRSGPRCRSAARCHGNPRSALPAAAPPCSAFRRAGAPRLAARRGGLCPPAAGALASSPGCPRCGHGAGEPRPCPSLLPRGAGSTRAGGSGPGHPGPQGPSSPRRSRRCPRAAQPNPPIAAAHWRAAS